MDFGTWISNHIETVTKRKQLLTAAELPVLVHNVTSVHSICQISLKESLS